MNLFGIIVVVGIILIVVFIIFIIVGDLVVFELILVTRSGLSKSMSKTLTEHLSRIEAHIGRYFIEWNDDILNGFNF